MQRHVWATGDVVLWDNRRTMHAATFVPDDVAPERVMWRVTVSGTAAAEERDAQCEPAATAAAVAADEAASALQSHCVSTLAARWAAVMMCHPLQDVAP